MTTTTEIRADDWKFFFDAFSRQHTDWPADLEIVGPDTVALLEAEDLPFVAAAADCKGAENSISLILGESADRHVTHRIRGPVRVSFERSDEDWGGFEVLAIEDASGTTTLLSFKPRILPENLDGLF